MTASHGTISARTRSAEETMALGGALAGVLVPGDIVLLAGDLGAGKTTLTKGLAAALGVAETVTSPTFTLVRTYPCAPGRRDRGEDDRLPAGLGALVHADLFRLDHLREVVDLAIGELLDDAAAVVEWGDVAVPVLGRDALVVGLTHGSDPSERLVSVDLAGPWASRRDELVRLLAPWCS